MPRNSTIETFRRRYHGDSTLRLLHLAAGGQELLMSQQLTKGFFIGRDSDTNEGAYTASLTIDTELDLATDDDVLNLSFVDLVAPGGAFQRFKVNSDAPPQHTDTRYVLGLEAAFNNALPIVGVVVYNPESSPASIFSGFVRHAFTQSVASDEWIVNHNMGVKPLVQLLDTTGHVLTDADIWHVNNNQFRVLFDTPVAGTATYI